MGVASAFKKAPKALPQTGAASVHMDAMRGIAALTVFLCHWRTLMFADYHQIAHKPVWLKVWYLFTGLGHQAVIVFFVLSGYLVGSMVLRDFKDGWRWGPYLANRLTRLWVVLIPALALTMLIDLVGNHLVGNSYLYQGLGQDVITFRSLDHVGWQTEVGNLFFLQKIFVPPFGSNSPLWSLTNEFWYYMLFPLLLIAASRKTTLWKRILYAVLVAGVVWMVGVVIARLFLVWLMGAALAYAPKWKPSRARLNAAIALGAILVFGAANAEREFDSLVWLELVLGLSCALLLWLLLQARNAVRLTPGRKCWQGLASMSYTLYLVHMPILIFLVSMINQEGRWVPSPHRILLSMTVLAVTFAFAIGFYFCFERNTGRLRLLLDAFPSLRRPENRRLRPTAAVGTQAAGAH